MRGVRFDRRDKGALPRSRDPAPPEDRPIDAEAAQALRRRLARGPHPGVRLDERGLDEESGEELLGPPRLTGDALPLLERGSVLRLERDEDISHLPTELIRLLAFEDDGQVAVASLLDDQRIGAVDDGAERLTAEDRERGAHEILDDVEGGAEQILVDCRLARLRFRRDQRAIVERQEHRLDRIAAGRGPSDCPPGTLPAALI